MSGITPTLRAAGLGLGTLALAGLVVAAVVFGQRTPARGLAPADIFSDGEGTAIGDVPYLPPKAIRRA